MIKSNTGFFMGMSRRAWEAKDAGKLMDHEFIPKYDITFESLDFLSDMGVIDGSEWHHVEGGCCLLKEHFYVWNNETYIEAYRAHKDEIDALSAEFFKIRDVRMPKNYVGHIHGYVHDKIKRRGNRNQREEEHLYFSCLIGNTEEESIEAMKAAFPHYLDTDEYRRAVELSARYDERNANAKNRRMELKNRAAAFFD